MTDEVQEYVINPEGTAASVTWNDDSWTHDHSGYTYTVYLKFRDPALNPPDSDYGWEAGQFSQHYRLPVETRAMQTAQQFYDFLMRLRTLYSLEDTINAWRTKYEAEREEVFTRQRELQRLKDNLRNRDSRIAELETDYVKGLETEIKFLRGIMSDAGKNISEIAKLLGNPIR